MKAVILAAGMGTRLHPITEELPKAFLPVDEKPLIHYSLENLAESGITDVVIVTGFLQERFHIEIGESFNGKLNIEYAHNPRYQETGSMYSLSQTKNLINGEILLLESDLLYEERAISEILEEKSKDVMLVAPLSGSGDEVYITVDEKNHLTNLGKDIPEKDQAIGELVGITKLSYPYLQKVWEYAEYDYELGEENLHYEEVIVRVAQNERPLQCLKLPELAWIEIDKAENLRRAREEIFPVIHER
ncbi:MAG: phosphocholine cytidylyltransferase family protein [Candidatus Marinimicrobia bacterium]|nr:phosphocholine cytidylyltransferase family protein [Candidatus Neomarinimicrobiota bacterium]MCF7829246.1 phosphocholine cytidylyltransferase family protein [Candidatus Neomarinimicrobiota bacterium]MCF7881101.1 phosphocholine cytidylyltransferase family protein [Candidatus Neomarinimicrobiota bacterium]